jgi:hypothetical protein
VNWNRVKLLSGVIGASAVVAMGVLTAVFAGEPGMSNVNVSEPDITLGETVTTTTGQTALETSVAEPPVIASTPEGMTPP